MEKNEDKTIFLTLFKPISFGGNASVFDVRRKSEQRGGQKIQRGNSLCLFICGNDVTVNGNASAVQHEASVSQVDEEMLFYMQQRGLTRAQAMSLAVNGFINDLVKEFPMEYSVELRRLIDLEMEDSIG